MPHLSAAENIFLGAAPTRGPGLIDWKRLHAQARALLTDLGMTIEPSTPLDRLSLAERQMVEIAKALAPSRSGEPASVLVMDGQTTVIGGIYLSTEQYSTDKTPGLSRIPLLNWLFKRENALDSATELLIFITPRITKS